jgi:tripeptide aminopeptidase
VRSTDPRTGLGADDRAGVAVTLFTAIELMRRGTSHPPLTFLWTVQEEIGLHGARHIRLGMLGRPQLAFNWDGGAPFKMTVGATGGYRMQIEINGLASHAGGAPQEGISAIAIAGLAIAELQKNGWHGLITKGRKSGTSNIGVIEGGAATNVVTDHVTIKAEARSHDAAFRCRIVNQIERAFRGAVDEVRDMHGNKGRVSFQGQLDYDSFQLAEGEPAVAAAAAAIAAEGHRPLPAVTNGGLDANWMYAHGIPTVSLGCGQLNQHTVSEALDLDAYWDACRIAWRLATDS